MCFCAGKNRKVSNYSLQVAASKFRCSACELNDLFRRYSFRAVAVSEILVFVGGLELSEEESEVGLFAEHVLIMVLLVVPEFLVVWVSGQELDKSACAQFVVFVGQFDVVAPFRFLVQRNAHR